MEHPSDLSDELKLKLYYGYLYSKEPKTPTDILFMQQLDNILAGWEAQEKARYPKNVADALERVINYDP